MPCQLLAYLAFFYYFQIFHYEKFDLSYQNSSDEDINLTARDDDPTDARPSRKMEIEDENECSRREQ